MGTLESLANKTTAGCMIMKQNLAGGKLHKSHIVRMLRTPALYIQYCLGLNKRMQ